MYEINKDDKELVDYINITGQTPEKLGRKLAYTSTFNSTHTLIGRITSLRTAMDYIITPDYPIKYLTKGKLTSRDITKIPTDTIGVVNYWAIVTHLVFERITQDKSLFDAMLEVNRDINFTSFNIKKNFTSSVKCDMILYNDKAEKYVGIVAKIHALIHDFRDKDILDMKIRQLIHETKVDKNKGLFDGVPFKIDFDDEQLEAS